MFQKIAYFGSELGIHTGLNYQRGSYGPFASELKAATGQLMNNGLIREEPRGRMLEVLVGPAFEAAAPAYRDVLREWEEPINAVAELMSRFTTNDAEVAATVHFAWKQLVDRTASSRPKRASWQKSWTGSSAAGRRSTNARLPRLCGRSA